MAGSFLFAGGGSGGHVSPGLAVAERLLHHDPDAECHFICSQRPIDRVMMDRAGMSFDTMPACGLGRTPGSMLNWYRRHRETTAATRALLQSRRFDLVLTLGGYVAAPVARAAASEHVPVFLLNLDRVPGKANRAIAARTRNRLSAVEPIRVRGEWDIVGMPIRSSAMAPDTPEACRRTLGLDPDRKVLLLTGASQGARTLNQALPKIAANRPETFDEWQVLHLCGDDSIIDALTDAWTQSGVEATVASSDGCESRRWRQKATGRRDGTSISALTAIWSSNCFCSLFKTSITPCNLASALSSSFCASASFASANFRASSFL